MIQNILTFIGGLFVFLFVLGVVFPSVAFHVYIGSEKDAKRWHEEMLKKDSKTSRVVLTNRGGDE